MRNLVAATIGAAILILSLAATMQARGAIPPVAGGAGNSLAPYMPPPRDPMADLDTLARTIWGEARGEGYAGMQAVANVIMNRYAQRPRFGDNISAICMKPYAFSVWNTAQSTALLNSVTESDPQFRMALDIARKAILGRLPDLTGGADHYLNVPLTQKMRGGTLPGWADLTRTTARIGAHTFLRLA